MRLKGHERLAKCRLAGIWKTMLAYLLVSLAKCILAGII